MNSPLAFLLSIAQGIFAGLQNLGIHPQAAARYAAIATVMKAYGMEAPRIISGRRTAAEQRELKDRYPDRAASCSWHTAGLALDLDYMAAGYPMFAELWAATGGRDGRKFSKPDIGHVDIPVDGVPKICV